MSQLTIPQEKQKGYLTLIRVLSVAIPLAVAVIVNPRFPKLDLGSWTKILPHLIAVLNTLTAILLIAGYIYIKQKNIALHRVCMQIAFALGAVFLVTYVLYHITNPSTHYGGEGTLLVGFYYFVLISHIVLSIVVVPFVLLAIFYAVSNQIPKHKRIVKYTYPLWLYVSVTGVIAYLMINPYYS